METIYANESMHDNDLTNAGTNENVSDAQDMPSIGLLDDLVKKHRRSYASQVVGKLWEGVRNNATSSARGVLGDLFYDVPKEDETSLARVNTATKMGWSVEDEWKKARDAYWKPRSATTQKYVDEMFGDYANDVEGLVKLAEDRGVDEDVILREIFDKNKRKDDEAARRKYNAQKKTSEAIAEQMDIPSLRNAAEWADRTKHNVVSQAVLDAAGNFANLATSYGLSKIPYIGHVAAIGALANIEQGNFKQQCDPLVARGMPAQLAEKYSQEYALIASTVEHAEQLINVASMGGSKALMGKMSKFWKPNTKFGEFSKWLTEKGVEAVGEGVEEVLQDSASYYIMSNMLQEWARQEGKKDLSKELAGLQLPIDPVTGRVDWSAASSDLARSFQAGFGVAAVSGAIGIPSSIKARKAEKQAELTKHVDEELRKSEIEEIVKANREIRKNRMSAILASRPELIPQLAKYNGPLSRSFASQIDDRLRITSKEEREYLLQTAREWNDEIERRKNAARRTGAESNVDQGGHGGQQEDKGASAVDSTFSGQTEKTRDVPVSSIKFDENLPEESVKSAKESISGARDGSAEKVSPIKVVEGDDGSLTAVDGNATVAAMKGNGETEARVEVVGKDLGSKFLNSTHLLEEKKPKGGLMVEGATTVDKAISIASENADTLAQIVNHAAEAAGGTAEMRPNDKETGKPTKSRSSTERKVRDECDGDPRKVVDMTGGTIILKENQSASKAISAIEKNLPEGASIVKLKKLNIAPGAKGYQDVKVSIKFPNGGVGEVIIIDDFMYNGKMKRGGHACYEITRILNKHRTQSKLVEEALNAVKDLSEAIYAKGADVLSPEEWDRAKANASSSVTRLVDSQDSARLSSRDMKMLKSSLEGLYLASPPSTVSNATPALSSIKNIDSSASRTNGSVSKTDESGNASKKDETSGGKNEKPGRSASIDVPSRKRKIRTPDGAMETEVTPSFVPASSLIASDSKNYPQQFQPRDREQSVSSKAQIENAANNLDPGTLLQDSRGSETGAPKILPNGVVLSGNGRTMMIRRAHEKKLGAAYDEAVRKKASDMGIELPELKNGDYWVYVEKVDMPEGDAVKFAESSNRNTILQRSAYEQAEADAKVMGADNELADAIAAVEASDDTQLRDGAFKEAATKFAISINASSEGLLDSNGNLTPRVYERMENAFIASLFETEPTHEARRHTRSIIERKTSGSGAGMMRAYNAVVRSAPALYRLSRLPAGKAGRDIRADVGKALSKYASLRSSGKTNQQIVDELSRQTMIPGTEDTSRVDFLVRNFAEMARKNISISRFLGGYVRRAETAAYEPDMFGIPPVSTDELLQKAADEAMENQVTPRQDVNASPMPRHKEKKAKSPQRTEQQKQKHKLAKKIASMAKRAGMNIHVLTGTEVREMSEASYGETTVNDLNIVPQTDLSNPENAEKFVSILNQYKGATPPHRLRNSDPQSAYKWFKDNLVGKTFNLGGRTFTVNEGHFFRFVCETPKDKSLRKGWISKAKSPEEARQMIEEGTISSSDIAGYVPARAATLPFALEALKSPDAIIRKPFNNTHKDTLIKKFDTNGKNSDIAVFILNGDGNTLGLATTHRRVITKQFINGNHLVAISDKVAKKSFSNPADEGLSLEDNAGDTSTSYEKNIQNPNNGVNSSSVRDGML